MVRIGDKFPEFKADSSEGQIDVHEYIGDKWLVFFSHPADHTPVCTTELGAVARLADEFAKRNTKLLGLSVDPVDKHKSWIKDINETQNTEVKYPILSDTDRKLSKQLNMLDQDAEQVDSKGIPLTVRSLFIVDPNKTIRLILTYPASCGRNFNEVLRTLDSLQLTTNKKLCTPANWKQGEDLIIAPSVSNEDAKKLFGDFKEIKPYLRTTAAANANK